MFITSNVSTKILTTTQCLTSNECYLYLIDIYGVYRIIQLYQSGI